MNTQLTTRELTTIKSSQCDEITGYHIYRNIAKQQKRFPENQAILNRIADDEMKHYNWLKRISDCDVAPSRLKIVGYSITSRILGPTFAIKLLEKNEELAQAKYGQLEHLPQIKNIMADEETHERELIEMVSEERLNYMGSVVLGLNDALVELTGALAGLTFALQNAELIALTGSITGIAAAFSMAASEYLSTKSENNGKKAIKASWYTGVAYMFTVLMLILPFLVLSNIYLSLGITLGVAALIIAGFNYYYAIVKDEKFGARFIEMITLSFSVAALSFGVGWLLRNFMGIDV